MKEIAIKYLAYVIDKLKEKPQVNKKSISSLAPKILTKKDDLDLIAPYINRLKEAIDQKGITNIALTGIYGSGKSTILQTFQYYLYPTNYRYINISLASFKDNKQDKPNEDGDFERQLEISILQQIFYHVKPSRIPDSRFKRIINLSSPRLFLFSFSLVLWLLSIFILFKFGYIDNLNPSTWHSYEKIDWSLFFTTFIFSSIFFAGIGCFCRKIIRLFTNSKINKLNIKGEVELGNETDTDTSVFNKHLEEIIYFFQRTKCNVLIIEDLDRFNTTQIFTKLREINILLNKSELLKGLEVNFIYAIGDEIFTDKAERVKFFEYIIPVIPFINQSNAGTQLAKLIEDSNLKGVLSEDFTEDVVTFIDDIDMRLLINIFHEYVLYKDCLIPSLDQEKLFSIIVYKNLFPDDFGKLHRREGVLYKFISNKKKYIELITSKYQEQIINIESKITKIELEQIDSIENLRRIYLYNLFSKHRGKMILGFVIEDKRISIQDIPRNEDAFHKLIDGSANRYYYEEYPNYEGAINANTLFSTIESEIGKYNDREQSIKERNNNTINNLKKQITDIRIEISIIEFYSLAKIIQEIGINEILKEKQYFEGEIDKNFPLDYPLVKNLLLNGYIDENYSDYISVFHSINMTSDDYSFLLKVKSGDKEMFSYELTKLDQIIKKLPLKYFKNEAIFNFDLFDYLSQNIELYNDQYNSILELIKKKTENSLKFMDEYIFRERTYVPLFIQKLSETWLDFWEFIYDHPTYDDQKKDKYLFLILKYANVDSIYSLNKNFQLASYIETHKQFISLFTNKKDINKITSVINKLNIYFEELELPNGVNDELFKYIYENDHYSINIHNITLLLNKLYEGHSDGIASSNYTTILNSNCEPLKRYIEEFLVDYLERVFLKLPNNTNENQNTLLLLLNNEQLDHNIKIKILQKQQTKIQNIIDTEDWLINYELFKNNKIEPSWGNVVTYYDCLEEKIIDDALIVFLNIKENYKTLNQQNINRKSEDVKDFTEKLILSNSLSIDAYKALIIKTPYSWNSIDFSTLDKDKVEWLIENKLNLTKNNLDILRSYFSSIFIKLIEKNHHKLMIKYKELELELQDHINILQSAIIDQSIKEKIIRSIDSQWIIENDDLKGLIENILFQSSEQLLEYETLDAIVGYSRNNDKRLHLIYIHIEALDDIQIQSLLEKLDNKYKSIFQAQKRPTFLYTPTKERIFKLLEKKGMIRSCKVKEDKSKIKVVALYK